MLRGKSATVDAWHFPFPLQLIDNERWHQGDRKAADSGFVGVSVWWSKWNQCETDKCPLRLVCFKKNEILQPCTDQSQTHSFKGCGFSHEEAKAQTSTMLPSPGNWCARMTRMGSYLALQLFFSLFLKKKKDLILIAFCVVLYFHAKILLYLNVFILLNVLSFFGYYIPELL